MCFGWLCPNPVGNKTQQATRPLFHRTGCHPPSCPSSPPEQAGLSTGLGSLSVGLCRGDFGSLHLGECVLSPNHNVSLKKKKHQVCLCIKHCATQKSQTPFHWANTHKCLFSARHTGDPEKTTMNETQPLPPWATQGKRAVVGGSSQHRKFV